MASISFRIWRFYVKGRSVSEQKSGGNKIVRILYCVKHVI